MKKHCSIAPMLGLAALLATGLAHAKEPIFAGPAQVTGELLLTTPPANNSEMTKAELVLLHQIQTTRTPEDVAHAKFDDETENMFLYKTVLGDKFTPEALPLTAALSARIANDESANVNPLKETWKRPRPYLLDPTITLVCGGKSASGAYPSGHATVGYIEGLALVEMVPEMRDLILVRADDYAHSRLVCGSHYPSDLEASKRLAYAIHAVMANNPTFQKELAAARAEVRRALDLPAASN